MREKSILSLILPFTFRPNFGWWYQATYAGVGALVGFLLRTSALCAAALVWKARTAALPCQAHASVSGDERSRRAEAAHVPFACNSRRCRL
jgi:uncharacterized membrane protein HdeD (DUF308 family)